MDDAITFIAHKRAINLPAMYMKSLAYDGASYISKLLPKYLGAEDTKLNAWIMEHMLVGMVKRVFNPGCKFDELMVLTGIQGVGKTSFIEKLALFPGWYCSLNNIKGKDAVSNLVGKVVVELEEFVALRNAKSADEAKLFISARTSTVRLPYERFSADVKRTCILIATTNDATFLGDFSGERRYLPVKVNSENIELPIMYDVEKFPILETITKEFDIQTIGRGSIIKFNGFMFVPQEFDITQTIEKFKPFLMDSISSEIVDETEQKVFKIFFESTDTKIPIILELEDALMCSKLISSNMLIEYEDLEEFEELEITIVARVTSTPLVGKNKPFYDPLKDFMKLNRSLRRSISERTEGLYEIYADQDYKTIEVIAIYQ